MQAERFQMPKTALAERYVEEGLLMDQFPGIVFRSGPAGRRPGVVGGPDVWEVVEVIRAESGDLARTAENLDLPVGLVEAAARFHTVHAAEVDAAIESNRRLMEEVGTTGRREQPALPR